MDEPASPIPCILNSVQSQFQRFKYPPLFVLAPKLLNYSEIATGLAMTVVVRNSFDSIELSYNKIKTLL